MPGEFEERIVTPVATQYTTGPKGLIFEDVATGERFRIYADDLYNILKNSKFRVQAKVINGDKSYKALRVKDTRNGREDSQPEG